MKQEQKQDLNNPKFYWAVKNDGSPLFKDTVVKYLNEKWAARGYFTGYDIGYYFSIVGITSNPIADNIELSVQQFADLYKAYLNDKEANNYHPEVGELVKVSDNNTNWYERIYLCTVPKAKIPIRCVMTDDEDNFKAGKNVDTICYKYMRQIQKPVKTEFTLEDMRDSFRKGLGDSFYNSDKDAIFNDFIKTL